MEFDMCWMQECASTVGTYEVHRGRTYSHQGNNLCSTEKVVKWAQNRLGDLPREFGVPGFFIIILAVTELRAWLDE